MLPYLWPAGLAFAGVLLLTPLTRVLAPRVGMVAAPRPDRWHTHATPLLGGVPIFCGLVVALALTGRYSGELWGVLAGSSLIFLLGLLDDVFHLRPFLKLVGVIVASGLVIISGLYLPWFQSLYLCGAVTLFWLVGITNAMNLLDNMDGLAAGIGAISGVVLSLSFALEGRILESTLAAAFAAAVFAFLIFNFHPASIFMGDCGSMFLGFFLASLTLLSGFGRSRNVLYVMAGPVLPFLMPIFDTTFVTVSRIVSGRRVSQGGRDHTSHRMARVAGSERNAVMIFYVMAALSGALSLLVRLGHFSVSFALIPTTCVFLAVLGAYLGQVNVKVADHERDIPFLPQIAGLLLRNGVFQMVLDLGLILISYYSAMLLRWDGIVPQYQMKLFLQIIPWVAFMKLTVFMWVGVYRDVWRYFGTISLMVYLKAVVISTSLSALLLLFWNRFAGFSRAVILLDGLVLLFLLMATRMSFQVFHSTLRRQTESRDGMKKALIYGAGERGALLVRQLETDSSFGYEPVGFIDDDPYKQAKTILGYKVLSDSSKLETVLETHPVGALLVACSEIPEARLTAIRSLCAQMNIPIKHLNISVE